MLLWRVTATWYQLLRTIGAESCGLNCADAPVFNNKLESTYIAKSEGGYGFPCSPNWIITLWLS